MKCIVCDKEFEGRSDAKFCSGSCRVKDNRQKKKAGLPPDNKMSDMNKILQAAGLPPLVRASDLPPVTFISSGIPEIDAMTGGFPRNRITEIFGMKGVGKTALMTKILNKSLADLKVFYVDTENAMRGDHPNIEVFSDYILESVEKAVSKALDTDNYDMIIVDSVASMIPRAEVEGDEGEAHMGLKARLMSQWMRKINPHLHGKKAAVVFINQQRESMNPYGPAKFTPGGHGLPYAASLRLELKTTKADRIVKDKEVVGHWVTVEVEKSRVCKPYQKARFKLLYE